MQANLTNSFKVLLTQRQPNSKCTMLSRNTLRRSPIRSLTNVYEVGPLLCCRQTHTFTNTHTYVCVASNAVLDYRTENMLRALIIHSLLPTSNTVTLQAHSSVFHFGLRSSGWRTPLVNELRVMTMFFVGSEML